MKITKTHLKNFARLYGVGLLVLVGLVAITTIITLNLTFIYPWISRTFNLDIRTGLSHETLLDNYRILIRYNNWPWITTLYMPDFPMSDTGEFHFWEVKIIFQIFQVIAIIFSGWLILSWRKKWQLLKYFNAAGNLAILIFGVFTAIMLIDFDFFFYWFHRAFFNNDYWIFNWRTDPVILALPAELFMIKGFIIIGLLFLVATVVKIKYHLDKKRRSGA